MQYRASTGPMLPASDQYWPDTGPYSHVYRDFISKFSAKKVLISTTSAKMIDVAERTITSWRNKLNNQLHNETTLKAAQAF